MKGSILKGDVLKGDVLKGGVLKGSVAKPAFVSNPMFLSVFLNIAFILGCLVTSNVSAADRVKKSQIMVSSSVRQTSEIEASGSPLGSYAGKKRYVMDKVRQRNLALAVKPKKLSRERLNREKEGLRRMNKQNMTAIKMPEFTY